MPVNEDPTLDPEMDPTLEVPPQEPPEVEPVQAQPTQTAPTAQPKGKFLSAQQIAAIRRQAREQGRGSFMDKYEQIARSKGYQSFEEMASQAPAAAQKAADQVQAQEPAPQQAQPQRETMRSRAVAQEIASLEQRNAALIKQNRALRERIANMEQQQAMERLAYGQGVNGEDVEYATSLLARRMGEMTAKELETFEPTSFFEELATRKAHLFGNRPAPAPAPKEVEVTTSPSAPAPRAPQAREVKVEATHGSERKVATQMSQDEYRQELARRGIRHPASMA